MSRWNIENRERLLTGSWGKLKPLRASTDVVRQVPDPLDREILMALSGASRPYSSYLEDSIPTVCQLKAAAQEILLPKICATGRCRLRKTKTPMTSSP